MKTGRDLTSIKDILLDRTITHPKSTATLVYEVKFTQIPKFRSMVYMKGLDIPMRKGEQNE